MSDYTHYSLDWDKGRKTCPTCGNPTYFDYKELLIKWLQEHKGNPEFDPFEGDCSWHDNINDMRDFSKLHPDILFTLNLIGDSWIIGEEKIYAKGGLAYQVAGQIHFPEFNKDFLE